MVVTNHNAITLYRLGSSARIVVCRYCVGTEVDPLHLVEGGLGHVVRLNLTALDGQDVISCFQPHLLISTPPRKVHSLSETLLLRCNHHNEFSLGLRFYSIIWRFWIPTGYVPK